MKSTKKVRGVYERDPGSGVWWIRYADEHGKLRRLLVGTKEQAKNQYNHKRKLVRMARLAPPAPEVPAELSTPLLLSTMIDDVLVRKKRLRSYREYARSAKTWKAAFPAQPLEGITPGDIERWRAMQYAPEKAPKPATINRHLSFLRLVYRLAINDGRCARTPFLSLKLERENNQRIRFLTDEEEQRLCATLNERDWLMVGVAAYTGMRQGEQFPMKWSQVDFENKVLTIPRSKHGESRVVYLTETVLTYFQRMLVLSGNSAYVFHSENAETPVDASNFSARVFRPALETAKIENFRWHDLRHTYGSRLAMAGATETQIASLMGHKSTAMAQRYIHLSEGHLHDTVVKLDAVAARIHGELTPALTLTQSAPA